MDRYRRELMPGLSGFCDNQFEYAWKDEREKFNDFINDLPDKLYFGNVLPVNDWKTGEQPTRMYDTHAMSNHSKLVKKDPGRIEVLRPVVEDPEVSCLDEVVDYILAVIVSLFKDEPVPESPSWWCIIEGSVILLIIVLLLGGLIYLMFTVGGFTIGGVVGSILGAIGKGMGTIITNLTNWFQTFVSYAFDIFGYILDGWRILWDFIFSIKDFIVDITAANPSLVLANLLTIALWMILQLVQDILEVELDWEMSDYYDIFEFFNYPINFLMNMIEEFLSGKDVLYYLIKILLLPLEAGTLGVSLIVGTIWYLFKELIVIIKNSL